MTQKNPNKNNWLDSVTFVSHRTIRDYIDKFFGYGNLNGDFWFVGLEEGDRSGGQETLKRVDKWNDMGRPLVSDVVAAHHDISGRTFYPGYKTPGKYQHTITPLVKLFLFLLGFSGTSKQLLNRAKHCQGYKLGRGNHALNNYSQYSKENPREVECAEIYNDTALLEFYPLPCRNFNENTWPYADIFPDLEILESRETYRNYIEKMHIPILFSSMKIHEPAVVIFYGLNMRPIIESHIGTMQKRRIPNTEKHVYHTAINNTQAYLINHTAAYGMNKNAVLSDLASLIRADLDSDVINSLYKKYGAIKQPRKNRKE